MSDKTVRPTRPSNPREPRKCHAAVERLRLGDVVDEARARELDEVVARPRSERHDETL